MTNILRDATLRRYAWNGPKKGRPRLGNRGHDQQTGLGVLMAVSKFTPTSLYLYYDDHDILIYIGITSRGVTRNTEHNKRKDWWRYVCRQEILHFPSWDEAHAAEADLIGRHTPPFNKQHNPDPHALPRYLATRLAVDTPLDQAEIAALRRCLPLDIMSSPLGGHVLTLTSRFTHRKVFSPDPPWRNEQLSLIPVGYGLNSRGAGRVCEVRMAGPVLVVGLHGRRLPADPQSARARVTFVAQKPQCLRLNWVRIDHPDDISALQQVAS